MRSGKCPKCGSAEVFVRKSALGDGQSSLMLQAVLGELFEVDCYLCLNCRHLELYAAERAVAIFGKGKPVAEVVGQAKEWRRV
jgi:predicted nucleic-acid-binding Zn-ribbon protein